MSRRLLNDEQLEYLLNHQADISRGEMAQMLNEKFDLSLSTQQVVTYCSNHKILSNRTGKFEKGQVSFNKGKKIEEYMSPEGIRNSSKTRFKKGQPPINFRPVGSERITKDGYIEVKTENPSIWKFKHRVVWEGLNGEVPEGHVLIFLDQDRKNCSIDNLEMVKREELVRINQSNNLSYSPKINESIIMTERVKNVVRELKKGEDK